MLFQLDSDKAKVAELILQATLKAEVGVRRTIEPLGIKITHIVGGDAIDRLCREICRTMPPEQLWDISSYELINDIVREFVDSLSIFIVRQGERVDIGCSRRENAYETIESAARGLSEAFSRYAQEYSQFMTGNPEHAGSGYTRAIDSAEEALEAMVDEVVSDLSQPR